MNRFFQSLILLASLGWIAGCSGSIGSTPAPGPSTPPSSPPGTLQHIVVLLQENRSFDNIFAGFPHADTTLVGKCKPAKDAPWCKGNHTIPLRSVPLESTGTPNEGTDIDHSHNAFEIECDADAQHVCRMDGFDLIRFGESGNGPLAKKYPYAYVERSESKPYWDFANQYTLADKMFFTETASSFIAHQMIISGTVQVGKGEWVTDQPITPPWGCNSPPGDDAPILHANGKISGSIFPCFTWNTIGDLLDAKNVSWCDYVDSGGPHLPFDFSGGVWNGFAAIKHFYKEGGGAHICAPNTNIFTDVTSGKLPSFSLVIPTLYDSDHPASGCNGGPWWVTKVVNAIGESSYWNNTAIVVLWDDWGGWYDNAPPKYFNPSSLGFRVGMLVISPYSRSGTVVHTTYDFGSVLKLVEQTFDLGSLGTTDASANSMEDAFDFTQSPTPFKPEPLPKAMACKSQVTNPKGMEEVIEHDGGVPE
jgi:phospholipase C